MGVNPLLICSFLLIAIGLGIVFFKSGKSKEKFPSKTSDLLWNVVFEWKWRPVEKGFEIIKESIKKYCPNCHEDLQSKKEGGYYFLFCSACKFISQEYYHNVEGAPDANYDILKRELENKALK